MKDTSVEWIESVPSDWETWKITHAFGLIGSGTTPKSDDDNFYDGDVPWVTTSELRETVITDTKKKVTESALRQYPTLRLYGAGTLLFAMYGATIGRLGILGISATVNQACCALSRPLQLDPRFTYYWLMMRRPVLIGLSTGGGQPNLSQDDLKQVRIPAPPLAEQQAIATFLDRETGKIDELVAKKERLIELLQEKRTALISHAVTKGLNPNAKMKDSGIEWLGKVPEHWNVLALKRICHRVDVGIAEAATHAYADEGVPIIRSKNVRPNRMDESDILRIEPWFAEKNKSKYLFAGDLVTVRTGYPGTTAVVPETLNRSQCFTLVMSTLREEQNPHFYAYFLNSYSGKTNFALTGWGTAQTNISVPIVAETPVSRPPMDEQDKIVEYLDSQTGSLDDLTQRARDGIDALNEYRTALVSAVVTGKIDVRKETPTRGEQIQ